MRFAEGLAKRLGCSEREAARLLGEQAEAQEARDAMTRGRWDDVIWAMFFVFVLAVLLGVVAGCTAVDQSAVRCKLAALEELPDDPGEITASDVVQVVEHVRRCAKGADAGR